MLSKSSSIIQAEAELKLSAGQLPFQEWHSHNPQCNPHPHLQAESNHVVDKFHKSCHRWLSKGGFKTKPQQQRGNNNNIRFWRKTVFLFPLLRHSRPESFISSVALWLFWVSWRPSFVFMAFAYILHNAIDGIDMENMFTLLRLPVSPPLCLPLPLPLCVAVSVCWPLSGILVLFALNSADTKRICIASSGRCA